MFCHRCGTQVGNDVQYCTSCGQRLSSPGPLAAATLVQWAPPAGMQARTGHWIGAGWRLVSPSLGIFFLLAVVFSLLNSAVPLILQGPLIAGFHIFCMKKLLGRRAEFADLFKGFNFFVPALVASLAISVFIFAGTLLFIIPGLVVAAMYKFTYLFILDKRMDFWQAMQSSHAVVKNDYLGFTLFLLAMVALNILGAFCLIVGLFITLPITIAAVTVAYQEIVGFDPRTIAEL